MPTRKITDEELENYRLLPFGKKHAVRILIEQLKPGENQLISRMDFNWKGQTPNRFCNQIAKTSKKRFIMHKLPDDTGWVVRRIA